MDACEKIYDDLLSQINGGKLRPGEMAPSLRMLAKRHKSTMTCVRQAIDLLHARGLVTKRHGKGIFVAGEGERTRRAMLICRLEGDLYGDIVQSFARRFSETNGCMLQLEELPQTKRVAAVLEEKISKDIRNGGLDAVFIMGNYGGLTEFLLPYRKDIQLFCFFLNEKSIDFKCPRVVSDWLHGGRIGVRHLCDRGCRELLIITHPIDGSNKTNVHNDFLRGCREEASASGIALTELHEVFGAHGHVRAAVEALQGNPGIDGIYMLGDYMAAPLYPQLSKIGRSVGEDIALLGYYNTPWTEALSPELSSIELFPRKIADAVCDMYFKNAGKPSQSIAPEVIARASSRLLKAQTEQTRGNAVK